MMWSQMAELRELILLAFCHDSRYFSTVNVHDVNPAPIVTVFVAQALSYNGAEVVNKVGLGHRAAALIHEV